MRLPVQLRVEPTAHNVDELLGVRVIVLADSVARTDRRHPHEAGGGTHRLRAEQRAHVAPAPGIGRCVVDRADLRLSGWCFDRLWRHRGPPSSRSVFLARRTRAY